MTDPVAEFRRLNNGKLPTERDPRYLEILNMSKYRILALPDVGPALKCANCGCGRNDGRGYIDFGLQVDWYGVVYLCTECLRDIAEKAGLFRSLELKILQLEEEVKERTVDRLTLKNFEATVLRTFEEVNNRFVSLHSVGDGSTSDSPIDVVPDEDKQTESDVTGADSGTEKPEQPTSKSSTVSGRKDVPELADLLNLGKPRK